MNEERTLDILHLSPQPLKSARKPKVILMKKAGPLANGLAQAEIGGGHPVSKPPWSHQPNGENIRKTLHDFESVVSGTIIDNHQLYPVVELVPHALERRGDEPLAVVSRHNNRQ
jgi:hypothetical protein